MSATLYLQQGLRLDRQQILRYLHTGENPAALDALVEEACAQVEQGSYRVSWLRLPLESDGSRTAFGDRMCCESSSLARHLRGCQEAVLFCATLGAGIDRMIQKNRLYPLRALVWDAVGTAGIEQLCDDFCKTLPQPQRPRFSPGYGDLPLETQQPVLRLLDAEKLLGVTLTDSLLMTPCKSVTALVGLPNLP